MKSTHTRKHLLMALCTALATVVAAGAAAQQPQADTSTAPSNAAAKQSPSARPAPVAGVVPLGVTRIEADLVTPGYRATKLLNQNVYNEQNQKIGKIEDLVIAPDGTLSVAVIDVGGFAGIGSHRVAIPVKQFTQMHPKIILPQATKEALKGLPKFIPA